MPNTINYATKFEKELKQKYERELTSHGLTTNQVRFIDAKTVKFPYLILAGYKDHGRNGGFNRQALENKWITKTMGHDRDVEYFVDVEDVDESGESVSAANVTTVLEEEHVIPETDAYRYSKLYADYIELGGTVDNTVITSLNVLEVFDNYMQEMDDADVPVEGRLLYVTPEVSRHLKNAQQIARQLDVSAKNEHIYRAVRSLDDVTIQQVAPSRFKTSYDFTDGFTPGVSAKQINMILVQPKSVIACDKHSYIKLWAPGTHTQGDGYLYQNRKYWDLWVIDTRINGIKINVSN